MPGMAKQDDYTRYTIRIPTPLYDRVKEAAGDASVNSLIVATLEEKYPEPVVDADAILREIRTIIKENDEIIRKIKITKDNDIIQDLIDTATNNQLIIDRMFARIDNGEV